MSRLRVIVSKIESMNIFGSVYELVAKVPKGKVTTYGALSKIVGVDPRVIGYALHSNKDPENIPCHRVIKSDGKVAVGFAFGGPQVQQKMLEKEGINFIKGKVDLKRFGFFL